MQSPARESAARHRRPSGGLPEAVRLTAVLLLAGSVGCASSNSDIHLAPLYTRLSTPGGGRSVELLAGIGVEGEPPPSARRQPDYSIAAVRPFWSWSIDGNGVERTYVLPPLGRTRRKADRVTSHFFPLYYLQIGRDRWGGKKTDLVALPFILYSGSEVSGNSWGWFPFYGRLRDFLSFDRLEFVLFPIYSSSVRNGVETTHVLWPIFSRSRGGGASGGRVWPIMGRSTLEGKYDRRWALWPFFNEHHNKLNKSQPGTKWMFFPFFGVNKIGTYRSYSVLWPFFGYAHDPRGGFWALDAPWPFIRLQRGGLRPNGESRTRFWPIYNHHKGFGLESTNILWPLFWRRTEDYAHAHRESWIFVPFLYKWNRVDKLDGHKTRFLRIWPLYQDYTDAYRYRRSFPALNPFIRSPAVEFHYRFLYELFSFSRDDFGTRQRSFAAIWRREASQEESRSSLTGLYASRAYGQADGAVRETSLLFGLLRVRHHATLGFSLMRPAFPGPGWPPFTPGPPAQSFRPVRQQTQP